MKSEKKIENGLVCVFDILGYKNILLNNSIDDCAIMIKDILAELPQQVIQKILGISPNIIVLKETLVFFEEHFRYIMVSDSVIMFFDYEGMSKYKKSIYVMLSIFLIINFKYMCFKSGFPMRSCIDFGSFYYYENIFAGKTIITCFTESEKLDFSGIIITEDAGEFVINSIAKKYKKYFGRCLLKYIVPLNNGREEEKYIIDWYTTSHDEHIVNDLRNEIFNTFNMHNKTIDKSVKRKINNTKKIIKYFLYGDKKYESDTSPNKR